MRNSSSSYPGRGRMYYVRIGLAVAAVVALIWFCSSQPGQSTGSSGPTRTPRPIPTKTVRPTAVVFSANQITATAEALSAHRGAVRIMTYNIQGGKEDRIPLLTSILQRYNPDILALQETNGWKENEFAIVTELATTLGMEYAYCEGDPNFVDANGNPEDLVLLSKFKIVDSETYPEISHCMIRAQIELPSGKTIQVFATHITPDFAKVGCANIEELAAIIQPVAAEEAVLIGDFNLPPPTVKMGYASEQIACPPILEEAGWKYIGSVSDTTQMWLTEAMKANTYTQLPGPTKGILVSRNEITSASAFLPLAVDFTLP